MRELINDSFYEIIKECNRSEVDYCLMESDLPYRGFLSHKDAVKYAMEALCGRYPWFSYEAMSQQMVDF